MLYRRNAENVLENINLYNATYSPFDTEQMLEMWHTLLTFNQNLSEPIVVPQNQLDGFCEQRREYSVIVTTPRIAVYCPKPNNTTTQYFTWYKDNDNTQISVECEVESDSIVMLQVQGDKLVYNDKLVHIVCQPPILNANKIKVYFIDLFGLPQSMWLQLGSYTFENEIQQTIRAFNGQLKYDLGKHPLYNVSVGEQQLDRSLRTFLNGLSASQAYYAESMDGKLFPISLQETLVSADNYFGHLNVSGVMGVRISDIENINDN